MVELKGPRQDVEALKQSYNEKPFLPLGLKRQGEKAVTAGARMVVALQKLWSWSITDNDRTAAFHWE